MVSFECTREEIAIIQAIVARAVQRKPNIGFLSLEMDITACHCNGYPLRLQDLLEADDFNFAHDVFGIRANIDRSTGELENCFLPRFAQPEQVEA